MTMTAGSLRRIVEMCVLYEVMVAVSPSTASLLVLSSSIVTVVESDGGCVESICCREYYSVNSVAVAVSLLPLGV
jgi:hypothetical protein